jgi:hypothetical protein
VLDVLLAYSNDETLLAKLHKENRRSFFMKQMQGYASLEPDVAIHHVEISRRVSNL